MAKIDKLKEHLKILRFWLGIVVASTLAIVGWLATNYDKASVFLIVCAILSLVLLCVIIVVLSKIMHKNAR